MKKILLLFFFSIFLFAGCGKYGEKDVIKDFSKKVDDAKAYYIDGTLEIVNNDNVYNYDVEVAYKEKNYYRVSLTNTSNNHTQVILKNDDGVYVVTPALNKSFKFQSDWPYSNSQIYLLESLVQDIKDDDDRIFKETKDGYSFMTAVNYPNNRNLVKQKINLSKKLKLKKVQVYNSDSVICMTMEYKKIDYSPTFKKNYFSLNTVMKTYSVEDTVEQTGVLEESIYPLMIPSGTRLTNEEKIDKGNGERIIMTFDGEKPFLLVEETANIENEFTVVPTYGEPYQLMDTLGVMTNNSLNWTTNGIEYYLVSDVLNQEELVEVAQSIGVVQTMK
ncbi:MAG TPA: outer membrane lipoprotein carrier protein LolA [Candidatus Faecimonas intestinavium]|nr:outer membrane lipoprotein carrier protein LolA [Candidatus Faecimonas intestinavium]